MLTRVLAASLIVLAVGCGSSAPAAAPTTTTIKPEKSHEVFYTVTVPEACPDVADSGYSDIGPGVQAEAFDGSNNLLGYGVLTHEFPSAGGASCSFDVTFPVKMSPDGLYRVTSGNSNRGFINRAESDFLDLGDVLSVRIDASFG